MVANGQRALPVELTSFVGRRKEISDVRRTLRRSRLVTVTGIAGVGKTRVAVKAAEGVRRAFADGVRFVELSSLTDPDRLAQVLARALEVPDMGAQAGEEGLAEYLADKELLLLLDTCEHMIGACSRLVRTLLAAAPGLRVLATSRQPLGAPGEHNLVIRPMAVPEPQERPSPEALARYESVALLLERITAVDPSFELTEENAGTVAELCRRLDGIPLALELAAVRARVLPVDAILRLIEERFWLGDEATESADPRHRTMQAAIAWSHAFCTEEERLLWKRLSVFPGQFDLAAAEAVCADDRLAVERVYPALDGLVAKSILVCVKGADRTVYRMLDSIREFGTAQMRDPEERRELLVRHRDHYFAVARAGASVEPGGDLAERWVRVRGEWPNLRSALEFCAADPAEAAVGAKMVLALEYLWIACGMSREGRHYAEWFVQVGRPAPVTRVRLLSLLSYILVAQGDLRAANGHLKECEAILATVDDPACRTRLVKIRGTVAVGEGDLAGAERHLTEAIELLGCHEGSDVTMLAAMVELGIARIWLGRIDEAAEVLEDCKKICLSSGQSWAGSWADVGLALVLRARGEPREKALTLLRDALRVQRRVHDASGASLCLELIAWLAAGHEDPMWVTRLLHASHGQWRQVRQPLFGSPNFLAEHARCEERLRRSLSRADYEEAAAEGSAMSMDEAIAHALGGVDDPPAAAPPRERRVPLTPREEDVARLIAEGLTNREIARRLMVGRRTVDTHVEHILAKLNFSARSQIAAWVIRHRAG